MVATEYLTRDGDYWKKRGVPYVPRTSVFFMQRMLKTKGMAGFIKSACSNNMGRVYGAFFDGRGPTVIVTEPDLLRDILVKDFHIFSCRSVMEIGDPMADNALNNLTGEQWKRIRTIITPAFTSKRMRQMGSIINDCSKTVLEVCEKHSEEGKPVNCKT
ncbi:Cytochrome P450 6j1 [Araneus ventricosus]|uniref:Cytochrome P450 6j1 n=1 Tax=Araneus ventricosus TaxID=182803 RepID=A0A4Y2FYG3_ARAVE|nr:Cytochrome P450 6j1 [Araneus ventricosus]